MANAIMSAGSAVGDRPRFGQNTCKRASVPLSSRLITREEPDNVCGQEVCAALRPRDLPLQQSVEGSGLLGNDRLGRSRDQQTASESGSESQRKSTRWIAVRIASS